MARPCSGILLDICLPDLGAPAPGLAGPAEAGVGWGAHAYLLFGGIQVLGSRLKELQHLVTLRDVGGQLDQGLRGRRR